MTAQISPIVSPSFVVRPRCWRVVLGISEVWALTYLDVCWTSRRGLWSFVDAPRCWNQPLLFTVSRHAGLLASRLLLFELGTLALVWGRTQGLPKTAPKSEACMCKRLQVGRSGLGVRTRIGPSGGERMPVLRVPGRLVGPARDPQCWNIRQIRRRH